MTHDNKENSMKITYEDVVEDVTEIVNERGRDYVYDEGAPNGDCFYFKNQAPSCVVGHWVHGLGSIEFESAVMDCEESDGVFDPSIFTDIIDTEGLDIEIEPDALTFLRNIQAKQDAGQTWGDALDYAIGSMESGSI